MTLSIIIPAYNSELFISDTISKLSMFFPYAEIIVVNDGSNDSTLEILKKFGNSIKIVDYQKNTGKGFALKQGFKLATGDIIVFTDADLPYPLEKIQEIVSTLEKNDEIGVAIATRPNFYEFGFRKLTHECCSLGTNFLFWLKIKDTQCGLKGFKKYFIKKIEPFIISKNFTIDIELLYLAKITKTKIAKVPVTHSKQKFSTIKIFDIIKMGFELLKIRLTNYKKCL